MIVAQQVENSMDEEAPEFLAKPVSKLSRLTPGRRHRDDHIAKQKWGQSTKSSLSPFLVQGEGQDVGGAVFFPIPAIEGAHAPIGDQHQAELRAVGARGRQDGLGCPAQPRPIDRHHTLTILQDDGHGDQ